jgi:DNA repair exonuclease SbcCD ATPase subunit
MPDNERPDDINYLKEAFSWQYNVIGLAGAAAFALVSGTALPLILGAGLELMYLAVVPNNGRFQRLIRSRKYELRKQEHAVSLSKLIGELTVDDRDRYARFGQICKTVRENYRRLSSSSQMLLAQLEDKLDGLQQSFLRLLSATHLHRDYLRSLDAVSIEREIGHIQKNLEREPEKVREINSKRVEILSKRLDKFKKIRENARVLEAQINAMEDVLELIRDQSVTMRDPQELSGQLDGLIQNVESTEKTVQEMESIMELTASAEESFGAGTSGPERIRT